MQANSPYFALGGQLVFSILFFVGGGYLLDSWLGTTPWLTLAGSVLGIASFFAIIYKLLHVLSEEEARKRRDAGRSAPAEKEPPE